jgi:DNA modification methylase
MSPRHRCVSCGGGRTHEVVRVAQAGEGDSMTWEVRQGDALDVLRSLPGEMARCCVTSPPYWGLRDYGAEGQIGMEQTPDKYVARLVAVFREVRRVLTNDGTLWLNLGDSYAGSWGARGRGAGTNAARPDLEAKYGTDAPARRGFPCLGIKPKDLVGIPWRVAFALQADGWWLRSDIIWSKPNPMPESVTDRPTKAHEYVFLLAKSERYFYDADAIAEDATRGDAGSRFDTGKTSAHQLGRASSLPRKDDGRRNRRSVWQIATRPFSGAHFATMPPDLADLCVRAGSDIGDTVIDPFCGAGTTGLVALRHGRSFVGAEINPTYAAMARERIRSDAPLLNGEAA